MLVTLPETFLPEIEEEKMKNGSEMDSSPLNYAVVTSSISLFSFIPFIIRYTRDSSRRRFASLPCDTSIQLETRTSKSTPRAIFSPRYLFFAVSYLV